MKRKVVLLALACAMMILVTGCGFGEIKILHKATEDGAYHKILTPTVGAKAGTYADLENCSNDMVRTTISAYYQALKSGDKMKLQELVTAPVNLSDEIFSEYADITDIRVKYIYTVKGKSPIDMVAYVQYDVYFKEIETPVPSLDELFLSEKDEMFSIINGNVSTDTYNEVVEGLSDNKGVKELVNSVNILFNKALEKDPALKSKFAKSEEE